MSISQKNHSIKYRPTANDVFITPEKFGGKYFKFTFYNLVKL